ncbi:hypothetical protein TWF192_009335 [Orbilia oligospora]|uniref:Membrane anchor Opy2 N-terminal domain-containing protein n=1 Tax=Orbilia oligospora TaxID=2813651 RepID=A0A6G1M081_ORBOL|nr:hypothetical protein TWF191_010404 [Orbilia oligospora]KAF3240870.1 hypothetical protein TWF192_009335 [Orbilia oligospora]
MAVFATSAMDELAHIFKRQAKCVTCPDTPPSCKTFVCEAGTTCILQVQSCDSCAAASCQRVSKGQPNAAQQQADNKSGAPVGAIVGGVFAFVVIICVAAFFLIRRNKKKQKEAYEASVAAWAVEKDNNSYGGLRDARQSTQSIGSIASTVLTRASNVIQIAYIPGVTNRSNPNSPGLLGVPPVPSIPGQHLSQDGGDHFFSAGDIARQSVWSTNSGYTIGTDPRASVATTIYRSNAIVSPLAATATVVRAKPAVVQVKSSPAISTSSSPNLSASNTPPVPSIDLSRYQTDDGMLAPGMADRPPQSPAFSVGSTFLNKKSMTPVPEEDRGEPHSPTLGNEETSPFSDRASILTDTVAPLNIKGRASPARHMEGDIRMSFRPISEAEPDNMPTSSRGRSPFADENRVERP